MSRLIRLATRLESNLRYRKLFFSVVQTVDRSNALATPNLIVLTMSMLGLPRQTLRQAWL
ncbi:MAG TPA: hypothetical protein VJ249_08110 [Candidatus Bathyarchaeia archaeon]|nr:hypothetical protein [Candidatus Bathyarchaeia archaeon]